MLECWDALERNPVIHYKEIQPTTKMDASADCGENTVVSESAVRPNFLHDVHGKLAIATKHKEEGTEYFKAGNYKKAISCYAKVTAFTRGLPGSKRGLSGMSEIASSGSGAAIDADDESRAAELETVALTNIAMCYLKMEEPRKAIEFCQKAITGNPTAWKALLRKAEAQAMMGNYEVARKTLDDALKISPDAGSRSAIIKEKEKQIAAERAANSAQNGKQKKAFSKMFDGLESSDRA